MMNSGSGSGNNMPGGSNNGGNSGGGGGPGPLWQPFQYQPNVREDGRYYPPNPIPPSSVITTYNPTGNIPPQNDRELGVLLQYRFDHNVRSLGYNEWNISNAFPSNSMIDRTARARLLNHIIDHPSALASSYRQMDIRVDTPRWNRVKITSHLINSLHNSNN